jgi:hypothetical protein
MAGFIITIAKDEQGNIPEALLACIRYGAYSTIMKSDNKSWNQAYEGTFADYFNMQAGDHVYFFSDRILYGIGVLQEIQGDCKYLNYHRADDPCVLDEMGFEELKPVYPDGTKDNKCFCIFRPAPYFFRQGVDIDEALQRHPESVKLWPYMQQLSFMKVDDEEDTVLRDMILQKNEQNIIDGRGTFPFEESFHSRLNDMKLIPYSFGHIGLLDLCINHKKPGHLKHEMALEAALCDTLTHSDDTLFGHWDYVSHQVPASPLKFIRWVDKMDIFGYRYVPGYCAKSKYIIIELKKDAADEDVIRQIMKYVDWVNQKYTFGDYSMIEAYVVAFDFPEEVIDGRNQGCVRNYMKGVRPVEPALWNDVKLIQYCYLNGNLAFNEIAKREE